MNWIIEVKRKKREGEEKGQREEERKILKILYVFIFILVIKSRLWNEYDLRGQKCFFFSFVLDIVYVL